MNLDTLEDNAMSHERLREIYDREQAATPGPWQWFGNTDTHRVYLATKRWGRQTVMCFRRWGMRGAEPQFAAGRTWTSPRDGDRDFSLSWLTGIREMAIYEVAPSATSRTDPEVYRADLRGIRHPDAEFIAHAREDVTDLLSEVARLRALLAERQAVQA